MWAAGVRRIQTARTPPQPYLGQRVRQTRPDGNKLRCNNVALPLDETPNRNPGHPLHGSLFRTENGAVSTCTNPARGEAGSVKLARFFRGTMPDLWHESWTWAVCGLTRLRSDVRVRLRSWESLSSSASEFCIRCRIEDFNVQPSGARLNSRHVCEFHRNIVSC